MNNAKIWLVVKPNVGLPFFLGAVTVIAISVHLAVMEYTVWYSAYWNGSAATTEAAAVQTPAIRDLASGQPATIVMPDGRTAQLVYK